MSQNEQETDEMYLQILEQIRDNVKDLDTVDELFAQARQWDMCDPDDVDKLLFGNGPPPDPVHISLP